MEQTYNVFIRLLDGSTRNLLVSSPSVLVREIKNRIREFAGIPIPKQRLVVGCRQLVDDSFLQAYDGSHDFPTLHLVLRLTGGKGGFGSLLRGAATKAGQKKTSNFDACRDMSGRRLRHVNAEKKLEEWRAETEERRLERIAEEYIKKKAKAVKKAGGSGGAEKYVEKYREDSSKCMKEVEKSVREAIGSYMSSKRKLGTEGTTTSDAKRLKIWMGKRKMGDSDSEDTEDDDSDVDEEENEKSVILDDGRHSDLNMEEEGSLGSVTGGGKLSNGASSESGSNKEKGSALTRAKLPGDGSDEVPVPGEDQDADEQALGVSEDLVVRDEGISVSEVAVVSGTEALETEKLEPSKVEPATVERNVIQPPNILSLTEGKASGCGTADAASFPVQNETVIMSTNGLDAQPLNLDEFNSAAELEVVGMERLKSELQARGLKCGGTLQERGSRLFLLKTTPLEKLPKKLRAK